MFDLSVVQVLLVLAIALLVVGPKRLPEMGKSLGGGLRSFRDSVSGRSDTPAPEAVVAEPGPDAAPAGSEPSVPAAS